MTRKFLILLNASIISIVIALQYLCYQLAPSIDPKIIYKDNFDKKAACIQATVNFNEVLLLEMLVGGLLLAFINYSYFKRVSQTPLQKTLLVELLFIIVAGSSIVLLTFDYVNRNMPGL